MLRELQVPCLCFHPFINPLSHPTALLSLSSSPCRPASLACTKHLWITIKSLWRQLRSAASPTTSSRRSLRWAAPCTAPAFQPLGLLPVREMVPLRVTLRLTFAFSHLIFSLSLSLLIFLSLNDVFDFVILFRLSCIRTEETQRKKRQYSHTLL